MDTSHNFVVKAHLGFSDEKAKESNAAESSADYATVPERCSSSIALTYLCACLDRLSCCVKLKDAGEGDAHSVSLLVFFFFLRVIHFVCFSFCMTIISCAGDKKLYQALMQCIRFGSSV